ncbi:hypothetical protein [Weissella minor]|uniref:Uncharacterized protein n=1 Tax=Weissella minor TaxID=1620 RepID=A0A0R2JI16_9LACO|nr:hypothetical protein [Weissella minor]KRN76969.1 hypothetical protein IV67_GL000481 [Weissella minor]
MSKDVVKNTVIGLLVVALLGAVYGVYHERQEKLSINTGTTTQLPHGKYKVHSSSKVKNATVENNKLKLDKTEYYMVPATNGKNAKNQNVLTTQNVKNGNTFLYSLKKNGNKIEFRAITNGETGKIAFTLEK